MKPTNVTVQKSDIHRVAHTVFQDNGMTSFITHPENSGITVILLRSILQCFGDYKIVYTDDFFWNPNDDKCDIEISTNLPWEIYSNTPQPTI